MPLDATATGCIDDTDATTPGWQGNLTVHVTASGANVVGSVITFTDGATTFGTATTDAERQRDAERASRSPKGRRRSSPRPTTCRARAWGAAA